MHHCNELPPTRSGAAGDVSGGPRVSTRLGSPSYFSLQLVFGLMPDPLIFTLRAAALLPNRPGPIGNLVMGKGHAGFAHFRHLGWTFSDYRFAARRLGPHFLHFAASAALGGSRTCCLFNTFPRHRSAPLRKYLHFYAAVRDPKRPDAQQPFGLGSRL
jgi:hypothetical protein